MPNNFDEVVEKNRRYLTRAQIEALAKASTDYGAMNAGRRADAIASLRDQYNAGYRGLQNMGLAGGMEAQAISGEVPRLAAQVQTPFDQFNRRLMDVENKQMSALGANFARATKIARAAAEEERKKKEAEAAEAAAAAEEAARAAAKREQQNYADNFVDPRTQAWDHDALSGMAGKKRVPIQATPTPDQYDSPIGPPTAQQWAQQQERQRAFNAALAAAKATNMPVPNLPQQMKTARFADDMAQSFVPAALEKDLTPPTIGMDTDTRTKARTEINAAQEKVAELQADRNAGKSVSDADYKLAKAQVDMAKLKTLYPDVFGNMPEFDAATAEKEYTSAQQSVDEEMAKWTKSGAAVEGNREVYRALSQHISDLDQQRKDLATYKNHYDAESIDTVSAALKNTLAEIKKLGYTEAEAREFLSAYKSGGSKMPESLNKALQARDTAELKYKNKDTYLALQYFDYLPQIKKDFPDLADWVESTVADYNMQQYGFKTPGMSDQDYNYAKSIIKDLKDALRAVDNAQADYNREGPGETEDVVTDKEHAANKLKEATKALEKRFGMSVDQAREYVDKFAEERDARSEYNYYKDGMLAQLREQGSKPTKPVNRYEKDSLYRLVNGLPPDLTIGAESGKSARKIDSSAYEYLTQDQRNAYNAIYERSGIDAANKFYESIIPYLNIQRAMEDERYYQKYADEHPFIADLRSIGANLVWNVPAAAENLAKGIVGRFTEERPYYDTKSNLSFRSARADIIRSERSQNILNNMERPEWANQTLNFAYNTGMSIGDSAAVMGLAYLGAPEAVTSVLFGASAGNQAYKDAIERGATQDQALSYAIVNGVAEGLFEEVSLEKVMSMDFTGKGAALKNLLSQSFVEGSEEFTTGLADLLSDLWIMKDKSAYELAKKQYIAQDKTENEAERLAFMDQVKDIGMDALGGFVSGAAFAGGGALISSAKYKIDGKKINSNKSTIERYTRAAELLGGKSAEMLEQYNADSSDANAGKLAYAVNEAMRDLFGKKDAPDVSKESSIDSAARNPDGTLDLDSAVRDKIIDKATAGSALLSGDRMNAATAGNVIDILGKDYLSDMGYDASTPEAFSNDYNSRLSKYGIKSYGDTLAAVAPTFKPRTGTLEDYRMRKADTSYRAERPSISGGVLTGKALQQRQQNRQTANVASQEAAAFSRVYANPDQGFTTTADGNRFANLHGNMTAVARAEYERQNFKAQTTAKMDGVTLELSGMEARKGLTDAQIFAEAKKAMTKDAAQKLDVYMKLSKALSLPMVIRDVVAGTSGYVHDGTLYVTLSGRQSIPRVVAHELTHYMKDHSATKYDALRNHLIAEIGQKKFDELVNEKAQKYGLDLSTEAGRIEADDEVCAELCERMLSDTDALERFAEKNTDAAVTLRDRLLKILNAIKAALKDPSNRDFGTSKSDLIKDQETVQAWYDGISDAIKSANEREQTEASRESKQAQTRAAESDEIVMFDSDRIKSADPVTYDDKGNIIPLSERFNAKSDDIRYSIDEEFLDAPETKAELTGTRFALDRKPGIKPQGKNPVRDVEVPEVARNGKQVSDFTRSFLESNKVTNDIADELIDKVESGEWGGYTRLTNEEAMGRAKDYISKHQVVKAQQDFHDMVMSGQYNVNTRALGLQLLTEAAQRGDKAALLDIASDLRVLATDAGQSVQIFSVLKDLGGVGSSWYLQKVVERMNNKYAEQIYEGKMNEITVPQELYDQLEQAKTTPEVTAAEAAIARNIADQLPLTWTDRLSNWRYMAMLANPTTHVRNLFGNLLMGAMNTAKDAVATGIERVGVRDQSKRTHAVLTFADKKSMNSFADQAYADNEGLLRQNGKFSFENEIKQNMRSFDTKALNAVAQTNFNLLENEDMWFIKPAFKNAFMQYLKAQGYTMQGGVAGKTLNGEFKAMTKAQQAQAVEYASEQAWKATFHDASALATMLNKISSMNKVSRLIVEGVMPFKKTPINIAKRGIEYSPAGIVMGLVQLGRDVRNGKITTSHAIDNLASGITGTALMAVGLFLSKAGLIRVGDDDDKKLSTYLSDTGDQTYSLKLGKYSFSLSALAPATIPLFMGAALYEMVSKSGGDLDMSTVTNTISGTLNPFMEMSFMSSLNSALKNYGSEGIGGALGNSIITSAENYFSQYLPTVVGKVGQFADPTVRTTKSSATSPIGSGMDYYVRSLAKKIPGVEATLQPDVNVWGRTTKKDTFLKWALDFANKFILPANVKVSNRDSVDEELIRVVESTGETSFLPTDGAKKFKYQGEDYKMTAEQYTEFSKDRGIASYAALKEVIASDAYQSAPDDERATMLENALKAAQKQVNTIWKEKLGAYDPNPAPVQQTEGKATKGDYTDPELYNVAAQYPDAFDKAAKAKARGVSPNTFLDIWSKRDTYIGDDRADYTRREIMKSNLSKEQKDLLDDLIVSDKGANPDYSSQEWFDVSMLGKSTYEKAKLANEQGIPVKQYVGLYDKKNAYSGEDKAEYMRREIMNSKLTEKQKELLDDLFVSDKGKNPDYSSPAWFEISMLGGDKYEEAKKGEKVGLKPETYIEVYKKWKTIDAKDKNGKTVSGLKKKRAKEYLDSLSISGPVYDYIWMSVFGYKSR